MLVMDRWGPYCCLIRELVWYYLQAKDSRGLRKLLSSVLPKESKIVQPSSQDEETAGLAKRSGKGS